MIKWYENGQKTYDAIYKDGKLDGFSTGWHENGQKQTEFTAKDGKPHGLMIEWRQNGKKAFGAFLESQATGLSFWMDADNLKGFGDDADKQAGKFAPCKVKESTANAQGTGNCTRDKLQS